MRDEPIRMRAADKAEMPAGWRTVFEPHFGQVLQACHGFPRKLAPTSGLVRADGRVKPKEPYVHIPIASWILARMLSLLGETLQIIDWEDGFRIDIDFFAGEEVLAKISLFCNRAQCRIMGRVRRADLNDRVKEVLCTALLDRPFDLTPSRHAAKAKNLEILYGWENDRFFGQEARNVPVDPITKWEKHLSRIPNKQFRFARLAHDTEDSSPLSRSELARYIARWIDHSVDPLALSFVRTAQADKKEIWLWRHQPNENETFYVLVTSIGGGPCRVGYHAAGKMTPTQAIELERLDAWCHLPSST